MFFNSAILEIPSILRPQVSPDILPVFKTLRKPFAQFLDAWDVDSFFQILVDSVKPAGVHGSLLAGDCSYLLKKPIEDLFRLDDRVSLIVCSREKNSSCELSLVSSVVFAAIRSTLP